MVTGSIAASHYATPRFTRDIDIVLELAVADAERVFQLFEPEFYSDPDALRRAARQRGMVNLIHREGLLRSVPNLDGAYIERWSDDLGVFSLWREIRT